MARAVVAGHDRVVWFQPFVYSLSVWACILLAFVPAALVAAIFRPLSVELGRDSATSSLRSALIALVSTAFVFAASLSTNTLWGNVSDVSTSVRDMAVQERELIRLVENYEGSAAADDLLQLVEKYNDAVIESELYPGSLKGNSEINDIVEEIHDYVDDLAATSDVAKRMEDRLTDFLDSRDTYLTALNDPGVPDNVWFAVIILGLLLVAVLALLPIGESRRFSSLAVVGVVFAVGLIQLPMWILSSFAAVRTVAVAPLADPEQIVAGDSDFTSQYLVIATVFAALVCLVVISQMWNWRRQKRESASQDSASKDSTATTAPTK